jgi:GTPase Era involved in 16S rRNA processing
MIASTDPQHGQHQASTPFPNQNGVALKESLVSWWQRARPFFQEHAPQIVTQIDDDAQRLTKLEQASTSFCVCVLGQTAVGKSTLLNAIVAGEATVLPAGGIGPLTALATEVRYSADPYLLVTYRTRKALGGFRLQLEKELKKTDRLSQSDLAEDIHEAPGAGEVADDSAGLRLDGELQREHTQDTAFRELCKQATQILTADQFREIPLADLVTGFRAILGLKVDSLAVFSEADQRRIASAAAILAASDAEMPTRYAKGELGNDFESLVRDHVSGYLAPLVERINVGYPSSALDRDIILVDLPGVGIANDRYRTITSEYVRSKASAVILVVDRGGPTEASVDLIRDSGYWDRLLISSEDPENDPCELLVVVTKVDDVAREHYMQQSHLPKTQKLSTAKLFNDLRVQVRTAIRTQAEQSFLSLSTGATNDQDVLEARKSAQTTLMKRLEVFPVSAVQYRYFLAEDEDQEPFIKDSDSSGIPNLIHYLDELSTGHKERLRLGREAVAERLTRNAEATLSQLKLSWSATSRAAEEAEHLRDELARFLEPKRRELDNRKGAFREFLHVSGSARIAELVAKAQLSAQLEVSAYLRVLSTVNWATLRATVVRGGAFVSSRGVRIDIAADIAQRFQEPVTAIWGRTLLRDIRIRTRQYGTTLESTISDICEWADGRADTVVQREVLRAQERLMSDRILQLAAVGGEAVDELKAAIMRDLMATIEGPIREQCEAFRRRGDAIGPGVKNRILQLFNQLATEAVAAAASPAISLLESQFVKVRIEIAKALEEWGDPIQQASDAIIEREEMRRERCDAQRRKKMLLEIDALIAQMPFAFVAPRLEVHA